MIYDGCIDRSEIKLAGVVHPGSKLQVAGLFLGKWVSTADLEATQSRDYMRAVFLLLLLADLVVMLTDSLEHHGRNPTDVPVVLNHQVRPAAHQVVPCWKSALCCVFLWGY